MKVQTLTGPEFKTCCATLYQDKLLQFLLGPSLHPGGLALTRQLAERINLSSDDKVLDVGSGPGETAKFLASEYGCRVYGVELSTRLARRALEASKKDAEFVAADAEHLPLKTNYFNAVLSECSLCLFPDFRTGLEEIQRVLLPGGRLGVTDIVTNGPLPTEPESVLASLLCLAQKMSGSEYASEAEEAGFTEVQALDQTGSMRSMLQGIRKRLFLAEILSGIGKLSLPTEQSRDGKRLLALAAEAVEGGKLSYLMMTASKPKAQN